MDIEYYFNDDVWKIIKTYIFPIKVNITKNQIRFFKEYNIVKHLAFNTGKIPNYIYEITDKIEKEINRVNYRNKINSRFFDHCRYYKDKDGNFIVIVSPYVYKGAIPDGWKEIYKLYNERANTYITKILSRKNKKLLMA